MVKGFFGEYRFLSNFWPAEIIVEGKVYPTVEHAYQASKTLDPEEKEDIRECDTPGKAKRLGKKVKVRDDWDEAKLGIMEELVRKKFQIPELKQKLINTRDTYLEESNKWGDIFWGVCNGKGSNHLGKILMKVRSELC